MIDINHRNHTSKEAIGTPDTSRDSSPEPNATCDVDDFARAFRSPGHVHLLRGADGLLDERRGHTELGLALAEAAGVAPAVAGCEMLDDETGGALSTADAKAYAKRYDLPFVEGAALVRALAE